MKTYVKFWALILVAAMSVTGCVKPFQQHDLPPAHQLMHPGPGVDGPGPGVLAPQMPVSTMGAAAAPDLLSVLFLLHLTISWGSETV